MDESYIAFVNIIYIHNKFFINNSFNYTLDWWEKTCYFQPICSIDVLAICFVFGLICLLPYIDYIDYSKFDSNMKLYCLFTFLYENCFDYSRSSTIKTTSFHFSQNEKKKTNISITQKLNANVFFLNIFYASHVLLFCLLQVFTFLHV